MSGAVERAARRLLRLRVLSAFLLCALVAWFSVMSSSFRMPGRISALAGPIGVVVLLSTVLLLAFRIATAAPSEASRHLLDIALRYAPLAVVNLILLNVLAPVLALVAEFLSGISMLKAGLTLLGWLSGRVLFSMFLVGLAGLVAVGTLRLLGRIARRSPLVVRATALVDRAIIGVAALYCATGVLVTFNGAFDRGSGAEHRAEILSVRGLLSTGPSWVDVRSQDAGIQRIAITPDIDQVVPRLLSPGQQVSVHVSPGLFGIRWVRHIRLDFEHDLARLVELAPSAAVPRRQLIEVLLRDGRRTEAARHADAYARHHPGDREFSRRVAERLRDTRAPQPAVQLDRATAAVAR